MDALYAHVEATTRPLTHWIATTLKLPKFVPHAPTFYIAFLGFTLSQPIAAYLSRSLFPNVYPQLPKKKRWGWTVHCVSMVHLLIVIPYALYLANTSIPAVDNDKAFGWDDRLGPLHAITSSYFLWDLTEAAWSDFGGEFMIHGAACVYVYSLGFRPWNAYFGPRALLWELSTPFLNIHWFLDKSGKTGSLFQLINGVCLIVVFFCARLVYGTYMSIDFLRTMYTVRHEAPLWLVGSCVLGNITLNTLNWFWFTKMISALVKRFKSPAQTPSGSTQSNGAKVAVDGKELKLPKRQQVASASNGGAK